MAEGQGKRITDERRAVVLAALLEGQSVNKIAEQYNIPKSTVSRLKKAIPADKLAQIGTQKAENLAGLISANLEQSFKAISNVLNVTEDANWVSKQPAAELATFLGVTSDKVFRVLEAIQAAQNADSEGS